MQDSVQHPTQFPPADTLSFILRDMGRMIPGRVHYEPNSISPLHPNTNRFGRAIGIDQSPTLPLQ